MSCTYPNRDPILDAYCQGELQESERAAFEQHCFSCPDCRRDLLIWDTTVQLIKTEGEALLRRSANLDTLKRRSKKNKRPSSGRWIAAGGLAGVAAIFLFFLFVFQSSGPADRPSISVPYLEELVGQVHRGSLIEILSPEIGAVLSQPVRFEWTPSLDSPLELVILDTQGKTVIRRVIPAHQTRVEIGLKQDTGKYYWKLISGGDLLYLGKFTLSDR